MNTYHKYIPNVWLAKTDTEHAKGETIRVANKYGQEKEHIVHNKIGEKDGFFFYSITRADGFNARTYAKNRAEKLEGYQESAQEKSNAYYQKSNKDREFLSLGEPIKIGHHSEGRHRRIIDQAYSNMAKSAEMQEKADAYDSKIEHWKSKENVVNLSMPESVEYYTELLEKFTKLHEGYKNGTIPKTHAHSVTYANTARKEAQKNLDISIKLWA